MIGTGAIRGTKNRRARAWAAAVAALAIVGLGANAAAISGSTIAGSPQAPVSSTAPIAMEPGQAAAWQQLVSTPEGRAQVVADFRQVFGTGSQVGFGTVPVTEAKTAAVDVGFSVKPAVATGVAGDHFWFILNDHDIASGASAGLTASCMWVFKWPGKWICGSIFGFVNGYTRMQQIGYDHGVWGAVYWWPYPYLTGSRW